MRLAFRAVGPIDPAITEDIESGWTTLVASRLKALVETGSAEGGYPPSRIRERSASRERGPLGLGRTGERGSADTPAAVVCGQGP